MDTMVSFAAGFFKRETAKPVIILFYSIIALALWCAIPLTPPFGPDSGPMCGVGILEEIEKPLTFSGFLLGEQRIFGALLLMGILPACIVRFVFKERLADYGLTLGIRVRTFRTMLMTVPFFALGAWISSGSEQFLTVSPFCSCWPFHGWYVPAHLFCYFVFYYFSWEFFFRGFLLKGLAPSSGLAPAILIQTLAATLVHLGHPQIEIFTCILASLFWAFITLRTRSIVSGTIQHATLGTVLDYFMTQRFL